MTQRGSVDTLNRAAVVQAAPAGVVILSGASRRFIPSRRSVFSIFGSERVVEESLFGVAKSEDVNRATQFQVARITPGGSPRTADVVC
jgi:hypothetical protein